MIRRFRSSSYGWLKINCSTEGIDSDWKNEIRRRCRRPMNQIDLRSFMADSATLPKSTTLIRENGLRTLLLHLKGGEAIPEHHTRGAITVECLKGRVTFLAGEEKVELALG